MDPGGEVTRVELGGRARGRRWWPLAAAALGAWIVAALALPRGGGEGSAPPSSTTTTPPSSTTTEAATSTTTGVVAGAPLLGRATGWTLLVGPRTVDLDTGAVTEAALPRLAAATPDGVFTTSGGGYRWWPFPFDEATAVEIDIPVDNPADLLTAPEEQLVWTRVVAEGVVARALSLSDGSVVGEVVVPDGAFMVGVVGRSVVAAGGGRLYLLGLDGAVTDLGPGQPIAVVGRRVLLDTCDAELRCSTYAHDVDTGERLAVEGLPPSGQFATGPVSASGWVVVDALAQGSSLLGPDGEVRPLPEDVPPNAFSSAWTPDGEQLVVPAAGEILVVDPDVDGEARIVGRFELPGATNGQLVVLASPIP